MVIKRGATCPRGVVLTVKHNNCGGVIVQPPGRITEQCEKCKAVGVSGGLPRCEHLVSCRLVSLGIRICADCAAEIKL